VGVYTAPASGTATIQYSAGGLTATATLTVNTAYTAGVFFNSTTGVVTINAANAYSNDVTISPYGATQVEITLNANTSSGGVVLAQSLFFSLSQVTYIYFYGQLGFDTTFTNNTSISCTAYAGTGYNSMQGGSGTNYLYAGASLPGYTNQIHGGLGNDILVGGTGTNYLYAANVRTTLIAGEGTTYFYPSTNP
jgi:hypothetical protein